MTLPTPTPHTAVLLNANQIYFPISPSVGMEPIYATSQKITVLGVSMKCHVPPPGIVNSANLLFAPFDFTTFSLVS